MFRTEPFRAHPILTRVVAVAVMLAAVAAPMLQRHQSSEAATLNSGGFTTSASVAPATVSAGNGAAITVLATSSTARAALLDIEVYNAVGTKVYQKYFDNEAFAANQQRSFSTTWTTPAGTASGAYTVAVGVFAPGWAASLHWNADAGAFSIGGGVAPTAAATTAPGATPTPGAGGGSAPVLPAGWPNSLQIGLASGPNGAAGMKANAPYAFRYQYLAGGVNTGSGWASWNANGGFVTNYIQDSVSNGITPVFSYYMMYQSAPGNSQGEPAGVYNNLVNTSTMQSYYNDMKLFFQRAGAFPNNKVVLHDEPDLWGYIEQRATNDTAANVPVIVGSTGLPELAGLPDNASGFARAIVKLRDTYAPNVILGYHMSIWGTGSDIIYANPSDATVDALTTKAANFYNSLGARFDVTFVDASDRDAGFKQYVYGDGGASWWDSGDYARSVRMLGKFSSLSNTRIVIWQIPLGNTKMRAVNNTTGHYQDNHVERLLDDGTRAQLTAYRDAGVIGFMFGGGATGTTCACDGEGDGITNPAAINGNDGTSLTADDDGGFFVQKVQAYYAAGAMSLASGGVAPTPTPTRTPAPVISATRTPTATSTSAAAPTRTPTPATAPTQTPAATATTPSGTLTFSAKASISPLYPIRAGAKAMITARIAATQNAIALVDVEVYNASGTKVYQSFLDNRSLQANVTSSYAFMWTTPRNLSAGAYTVKVGVFSPGWGTAYAYNSSAGTITIAR